MPELAPRLPFPEEHLLLDELNHRINNEFASLIAIVFRAAAASGNEDVKLALGGVARLLHHYAHVHQALQPPDQEILVNVEGYLSNVCRSISRSKLDHMNIDLMLAAPPLLVESSRCWHLGMIVSELVTNAARHAFAGRPGQIHVKLARADGFIKCTVSDNGSAQAAAGLGRGLRIVEELTKALDGRLERKFGSAGSTVTLVFPYDGSETEAPETMRSRQVEESAGT